MILPSLATLASQPDWQVSNRHVVPTTRHDFGRKLVSNFVRTRFPRPPGRPLDHQHHRRRRQALVAVSLMATLLGYGAMARLESADAKEAAVMALWILAGAVGALTGKSVVGVAARKVPRPSRIVGVWRRGA